MSEGIAVKVDFGALPKVLMQPDSHLVRHAAADAVNLAGPYVQHVLAENTPSGATGKARQSVTFEPANAHGIGLEVAGFVGYGAPASLYIGYANDGTRPHRPPSTPLVYWAQRVLGDARAGYRMVRWIEQYGTRAQHFVEDTRDEVEGHAVDLMRAAVANFFRVVE